MQGFCGMRLCCIAAAAHLQAARHSTVQHVACAHQHRCMSLVPHKQSCMEPPCIGRQHTHGKACTNLHTSTYACMYTYPQSEFMHRTWTHVCLTTFTFTYTALQKAEAACRSVVEQAAAAAEAAQKECASWKAKHEAAVERASQNELKVHKSFVGTGEPPVATNAVPRTSCTRVLISGKLQQLHSAC